MQGRRRRMMLSSPTASTASRRTTSAPCSRLRHPEAHRLAAAHAMLGHAPLQLERAAARHDGKAARREFDLKVAAHFILVLQRLVDRCTGFETRFGGELFRCTICRQAAFDSRMILRDGHEQVRTPKALVVFFAFSMAVA
jgi:hypothetical protein